MKVKLTKAKGNVSWLLASVLALVGGSASGAPPQAAPLPFVSPIFGDNIVLQRGKPNAIWGWSQPGDSVRVAIGENSATATAGTDGKWQTRIQPPPAGGPYTVKIAGGTRPSNCTKCWWAACGSARASPTCSSD